MPLRGQTAAVFCVFFLISALASCGAPEAKAPEVEPEKARMTISKLTPVLLADDVQACVEFWTDFGMEVGVTIPAVDGLDFAMLKQGDIELMYQSRSMSQRQNPNVVEDVRRSILYFEVAALDDVLAKLGEYEVVVPENTTDYGAREIYVRDPAGHVIGFAEQASAQ